jgi:hypothetical protein
LNYGGEQYPLYIETTEKDLKKVDFEMVKRMFEEGFRDPSEFTFTFVGNFGKFSNLKKTAIPMLTTYLGSIPEKSLKILNR